MDAVTALSGSGPAYVFLLAEAMASAGIAAGLPPALATRLARETVAGSAELMHRSDARCGDTAAECNVAGWDHRRRARRTHGTWRLRRSIDAGHYRRHPPLARACGLGVPALEPSPLRTYIKGRIELPMGGRHGPQTQASTQDSACTPAARRRATATRQSMRSWRSLRNIASNKSALPKWLAEPESSCRNCVPNSARHSPSSRAHIKEIDRTVLAGGDADMAEEPARERLFDVLMRRLEALAPYKDAVRSIMCSARRNPGLALAP